MPTNENQRAAIVLADRPEASLFDPCTECLIARQFASSPAESGSQLRRARNEFCTSFFGALVCALGATPERLKLCFRFRHDHFPSPIALAAANRLRADAAVM
ncbi:hypothetical protein [Bradyrhizobium sp. PRIMUS42]|uniref:hypothetical protein n=1 Tax=Bradyrhizobium sp. PRIMUS42 TaxID=2908926 RepID=UPI001FF43448|nr:hypothetical protein [Bradyrhizobium sp. PRIMUS42]MCJ9734180.1 hypothetical protein [Bradyrhizobium sp. PRIMUS42]